MSPVKTVLADVHQLFIDGFERVLEEIDYPELKIVGKAFSARELSDLLYETEADLLFMELNFCSPMLNATPTSFFSPFFLRV